MASDDVVVIEVAKRAGEPSVVTVNCPDQTGLGCDICRVILEFGLCITRGGEGGSLLLSLFLSLHLLVILSLFALVHALV